MFSFMHVISAISECHVTIYIDSRVPFITTSWIVGIKLHTMIMQRKLEVASFSGSSPPWWGEPGNKASSKATGTRGSN